LLLLHCNFITVLLTVLTLQHEHSKSAYLCQSKSSPDLEYISEVWIRIQTSDPGDFQNLAGT